MNTNDFIKYPSFRAFFHLSIPSNTDVLLCANPPLRPEGLRVFDEETLTNFKPTGDFASRLFCAVPSRLPQRTGRSTLQTSAILP
jgi:hypothetical protein